MLVLIAALLFSSALSEAKFINNYEDGTLTEHHEENPTSLAFEGHARSSRVKRAFQVVKPIETYAAAKEQLYGKNTPTVAANQKNSVTSYTFQQVNSPKGVIKLPLVVRARITPNTIQPKNSRPSDAVSSSAKKNADLMGMQRSQGNPDEYGHLVSYKNGGSSEFFNIVPQTKRINRGSMDDESNVLAKSVWYAGEGEMTEFVEKTGGSVELIVVAYYDGSETRPAAFGAAEKRYNAAGNLIKTVNDYFYLNSPVGDPDIINSQNYNGPS